VLMLWWQSDSRAKRTQSLRFAATYLFGRCEKNHVRFVIRVTEKFNFGRYNLGWKKDWQIGIVEK